MRKLLIFLLAALTLAACSSTPAASTAVPAPVSSTDLAKVTLRVGDQKGGSQALLTAAGLVNTPYRIEWSTFTSGPPLLEAANAGAIDIGGVGNTPPLFSAAANSLRLYPASLHRKGRDSSPLLGRVRLRFPDRQSH